MTQESELPNWQALEDSIFETASHAIVRLKQEQPYEIFSFFAFGIEEDYSNLYLSFDTFDNTLTVAKNEIDRIQKTRMQMLASLDGSWKNASSYLERQRLVTYNSNVGKFAFFDYATVSLEILNKDNWNSLPAGQNCQDDYISGNLKLIVWKVLRRLAQDKIFENLRLSSPFYLGYQLPDELMVIVDILNWP